MTGERRPKRFALQRRRASSIFGNPEPCSTWPNSWGIVSLSRLPQFHCAHSQPASARPALRRHHHCPSLYSTSLIHQLRTHIAHLRKLVRRWKDCHCDARDLKQLPPSTRPALTARVANCRCNVVDPIQSLDPVQSEPSGRSIAHSTVTRKIR